MQEIADCNTENVTICNTENVTICHQKCYSFSRQRLKINHAAPWIDPGDLFEYVTHANDTYMYIYLSVCLK